MYLTFPILLICVQHGFGIRFGVDSIRSWRSQQQQQKNYFQTKLKWVPNGIKNGFASGLAATVVKAILQPLDTIKTIQQASSVRYNPIKTGVDFIKTRGVLSLWSGLGITILGSAPSVAVYFGSYSSIKNFLGTRFPSNIKVINIMLSAAIGNTIASVFRAPYEVIKQQIQTGAYSSTTSAIAALWRKDGLGGFFAHGQLTSQIVRDVPYAVLTLLSYELLQTAVKLRRAASTASIAHDPLHTTRQKIDTPTSVSTTVPVVPLVAALSVGKGAVAWDAVCGALAGGVGSFLTTPMDVIKTRMMTSRTYSSVPSAIARLAREEGMGVFFVGCGMRLLHKVPANGLFFLFYEYFRETFGVTRTSGL